jgi:hypothetical protein
MCNQRLHARHPKLPLAAGGHPSKHSRCVHNRKKSVYGQWPELPFTPQSHPGDALQAREKDAAAQ